MSTLRQTIRRSSSLLRVLTPESSTRGFASSSSPSSSGVSFAGSTQGSAVNTVLNVVPQSTAYVCIEIDRDVRSADCLGCWTRVLDSGVGLGCWARPRRAILRAPTLAPQSLSLSHSFVRSFVLQVVERFGRFSRVLDPGIHLLIPLVERIAYIHSQKETPIHVAGQTAITKDNVSLTIDGVLFVRIVDPVKASYGVENPLFAVSMLAQTSMRSELGRIDLDAAFSQRDELNQRVVASLAPAARGWGLEVLRYEIKDILPPPGIRAAMELVAEADRKKRASILQSEGDQQRRINTASGEAEAIFRKAEATAKSVRILAESMKKDRGAEAVRMRVAEQYVEAFGNLAKEGTTVLLPPSGGFGDVGGMVAQALTIFDKVGGGGKKLTAEVAEAEVADAEVEEAEEAAVEAAETAKTNAFTLDRSKRKEG